MAIQLYVSNDLEGLCTQLKSELVARSSGVFLPWTLVTQTEGMNNWLRLQIAGDERTGIAANIQFLRPSDFIHKAYQAVGGTYDEVFHPDNICWLVYSILGESGFTRKFPDIVDYYREDGVTNAIKRLALAEKLADLLDQYQIYRPDFIQDWNKQDLESCGREDWQAYIWIRARQVAGNKLADRTKLGEDLARLLARTENQQQLQQRMPAVHLFGLSILTPYHLNLISQLGEVIDIVCYLQNPAPEQYWLDTVSERQEMLMRLKTKRVPEHLDFGNGLLTSWGKVIKDTFSLFFDHDQFLNQYEAIHVYEPQGHSLLKQVQRDVFENAFERALPTIDNNTLEDGSITITACHTMAREVESLYNYLVHLVDIKKANLSPREIVVMVSDIDAYAPFIKAVFDNAPYKFRYSVADETFAAGDNLITALQSILTIQEEGFTSERVMQLLDSSFIRARFDLSNLALIREAINRSNIRFGIEGEEQNDTRYVSWLNGLNRLVYGLCMSGEDDCEGPDGVLAPVDLAEGSTSLELVRFSHFIMMLIESLRMRQTPRSIPAWTEYLQWVLQNLIYEPEEAGSEEYQEIIRQLERYAMVYELMQESIPYEVFVHHFSGTLRTATKKSFFAHGGVTFCSLIPMRSIPFRVVAVLGLGFSQFPRKDAELSFNLMQQERRRGDRNVKENDKHLFLETILSAKEYLYISYIGQSVKDNTLLPASALVDELIDYLETRTGRDDLRMNWVVRQPLHGFSNQYNGRHPRLYTYLGVTGLSETSHFRDEANLPNPLGGEVTLHGLVRFLKHPIKTYFQQVLSIYYEEESDLLPETEMFALDHLQQWSLKQELIFHRPDNLDALIQRKVRRGELPLKNMAVYGASKIDEEVADVREQWREVVRDLPQLPAHATIEIGGRVLDIQLENRYGSKLVYLCTSKRQTKYQLEAGVQYLAAVAAGLADSLIYLSAADNKTTELSGLSREEALALLADMIVGWDEGLKTITPFHTDFGMDLSQLDQLDESSFVEELDKYINNRKFPCTDPYILRAYAEGLLDDSNAFGAYKSFAEKLVVPVLNLFTA